MDPDSDLPRLLDDPRSFLTHPDPSLRRLAISASAELLADSGVVETVAGMLATDADEEVRAEAAEVLGRAGPEALPALRAATKDPAPRVVEAVANALGEARDATAVAWLMENAESHEDKSVREAAVASLGAIEDPKAVPLLIGLVESAPPQVRRRAVVALSAFDVPSLNDAIEASLSHALDDRNPMVREAAQMVVSR